MPDLKKELIDLRRQILTMAASVEQRVARAVEALFKDDLELARQVRRGDAEIDAMDVDIEAECLRILALNQPLAGDLRFVLAVMRVNTDLERIADMAKGIAKRTMALHELSAMSLPTPLRDMAIAAEQMLSDAVSALADEDIELCHRIRRADQRVDDLQKEVFVWATEEIPRHVELTRAAIDVLSVARRLERIADLATNIAEDVIFLTEGSIIRHSKI